VWKLNLRYHGRPLQHEQRTKVGESTSAALEPRAHCGRVASIGERTDEYSRLLGELEARSTSLTRS